MTRRIVTELRIWAPVEEKLAAHAIEVVEVLDVLWGHPRFFRDREAGRDKMIGRTERGRLLTIIIQRHEDDATVYDIVTGWDASKAERVAWERAK